jgi:hypothetical protein
LNEQERLNWKKKQYLLSFKAGEKEDGIDNEEQLN